MRAERRLGALAEVSLIAVSACRLSGSWPTLRSPGTGGRWTCGGRGAGNSTKAATVPDGHGRVGALYGRGWRQMRRRGQRRGEARGVRPGRVSRRGDSHPAALRTGRDGLPSSGPHSPAGGERDELPVGEEARLVLVDLLQPGHRFGVLASESLELVHGPAGEVLVDAPCEEAQLGAVEGSVIVDPASHLRVDRLGEAGQVRAAATVEVPGPDLLAFRLLRLGADGRGEASEIASPARARRPRKV